MQSVALRAALFEAVSDGILLLDGLRFVDCNAQACTLYGRPREEVLGRSPTDFSPQTQPTGEDSRSLAEAKVAAAQRGHPQRFAWRHVRPDGSPFDVEVSLSRIERTTGPLLVAAVRDITERTRATETFSHRTTQLEALRATTADITRELDLTRLLRLLIARAAELVGASSGTVYLWEAAQDRLMPGAWHGLGDWQGTIPLRLGEAIAGTVAQTRQPLVVNAYRTSPYAHPVTLQHTALTASVG